MFRLAHISDPHLGPLPNPTLTQLATKRIFGYVNWRRNRKGILTSSTLDDLIEDLNTQAPDHLAVTGDLVNLALPLEITNAKRWLDSLGDPQNVSAIPGNHDAYVPRSRLRAEKSWRPFMSSDDKASQTASFPYLRIRNNIALIGVNSAQATLPLMATGYFKKAQAKALSDILDTCADRKLFRVVMIHHPPCRNATHWHKRLIGASRFRKVIKNHGAELVLHGHTHKATKMAIPGPNCQVPVVCVPSASQGLGGKNPAARFNMFEIEGSQGNWHCELIERGYSQTTSGITEINRQTLNIPNA
ncbi:metallophosphoesterase family protein [Cohaesibacter celericrescens]|uniref:Metallophosphatase n=1 Tax=Cohaesibacter celericrescens TaxID=2067669 RepID=A0A2N5XXD1_9HYPH|nr:metallophosphoesterase [Cohaesibacter celericrescens]PLW79173.1 metallophosphatase [Cohaesibacter celericrescens]